MELDEYQSRAAATDQLPDGSDHSLLIPLLGLAGEVGSLLTEYKKRARDGADYSTFRSRVDEELGDVLWYLANLTSKAGLSLGEVAANNLAKTRSRWLEDATTPRFFDEAFPESEKLPRHLEVTFEYDMSNDRSRISVSRPEGRVGNLVTDNAYEEDGYRFHDAYHFTFAALLAWSPVTRRNLKRKRKSDPIVDEVEDGGRAWVIEEAIAALAFAYAGERRYFENSEWVDESLLKTVQTLTRTVEVRVRSTKEWERAIVTGSRLFRRLVQNDGGRLSLDLGRRVIDYLPQDGGREAQPQIRQPSPGP